MKIEVINPVNGQSVKFLGTAELAEKYPSYCKGDEIIINDNTYPLSVQNLTGWFSLPPNNTNTQQGIDQDGTDKLNNYYSDRNVTWQAHRFILEQNLEYLAETMYQGDYLLNVKLTIGDRVYSTTGTVNGTYENGIFDMDLNPYYTREGSTTKHDFVLSATGGLTAFLPMTMPEVFIDDGINRIDTISVQAGYTVYPKITLSGNITGVRINSDSGFIETQVPGQVYVFDNNEKTVTVDGVKLNPKDIKGTYISLHSGENIIKFDFTNRQGDVNVRVEYDNRVLVAW